MSRESARNLIHWLRSLGGHVDERIAVSTAQHQSTRGLVAVEAIEGTAAPLVALPEALVLTPAAALFSLEASGLLSPRQADALAGFALAAGDPVAPISLLLAADATRIERVKERRRKQEEKEKNESFSSSSFSSSSLSERDWPMSPWGAYTASLPPPPPSWNEDGEGEEGNGGDGEGGCAGWFLGSSRETAISAAPLAFASSSQKKRVRRLLDLALRHETAAVERTQALLIGRGSDLVSSGVASRRMLLWARSQICSRAFAAPSGSSSSLSSSSTSTSPSTSSDVVPALLPVIDLCNHSPSGGFPAWGTVANGNAPPPPPPRRLCWLRNKEPLAAGDELTTDYSRLCGGDAAAWMVNYGFVPEEVK